MPRTWFSPLTPGTYYLGAAYTRFEQDQFIAGASTIYLAPGIAFNNARFSLNQGFSFPSQNAPQGNLSFFGPNFRFIDGGTPPVNPIPEPSEYAVGAMFAGTLFIGMVRGRRRKGIAKAA